MKKNKILSILLIIFVILLISNPVFAHSPSLDGGGGSSSNVPDTFGGGFDYNQVPQGNINEVGETKGIFDNIFTTVLFLIQIASVAGIIFCGIRYMYSSADRKADIKAGMIPLVIGIVLVFCASTVAQFVVKVFTQAT